MTIEVKDHPYILPVQVYPPIWIPRARARSSLENHLDAVLTNDVGPFKQRYLIRVLSHGDRITMELTEIVMEGVEQSLG